MMTLLLGLILAQNAVAAEPAACDERIVLVAQHDITEAKDAYKAAHGAFFSVDWKARMAVADDRDAVLAERESRWEEVKRLREAIDEARVTWRALKAEAAGGTLACDDTVESDSSEASAQVEAEAGDPRSVR